ncbi:MAG: hypothetical protein HN952_02585 [Candidatus Cloacimonetes bacterium]|jgi:saccharopine dehydrogenase (NAD+, L-lysine forming)|nr:hypothetical protein [Candidatus Cloacimonadota bacterium]MBT6993820.1 hypothetical protein [Candidatus Cloacimonadota bacterium]
MRKLGIKIETKNKWERRVPLNPTAVKKLVNDGFEVIVQPSQIRIYKDDEYLNVGAQISADLSECDLIIGVKEIPIDDLIPNKPHLFFSHTIKGQDYNMPLLQNILDQNITLFDYEKIADIQNRRLVFFGKFAGDAGMVDTLWGLGQRLKRQFKIDTPFLKIKRSFEYESLQKAIEHIGEIGKEIAKTGLPDEIVPLNIFLMGYGHVASGCKEILAKLPIIEIKPNQLGAHSKNHKNNKIYLTVFKEKDMVKRADGQPFELSDYFQNGDKYLSNMEQYLPHCSVYMNAIYWAPGYPVFLRNAELEKWQKLIIIGDITCDIGGSVEATLKATYPDNSTFIFNPKTGKITDGFAGDGIANCAVDNLPCEFPKEASDTFSEALMPFIKEMLLNDYTKSIADSTLPDEIKKACITHRGKLEDDFKYLEKFIKIK